MPVEHGELLCDCAWCKKLRALDHNKKGRMFGVVTDGVLVCLDGGHHLTIPVRILMQNGAVPSCNSVKSVIE